MSSAGGLQEKIITCVEENEDPLIEATLYLDKDVMNIMSSLTA
jgi:hypothetical protein